MWIFLNDGFFSIVEHPARPNQLQVRARKAGDLQRVFKVKNDAVIKLPHRDYMYRVYMEKSIVSKVIAERILEIDYTNFKDSIAPREKDRKNAYMDVWCAVNDWQDELHPEHSTKNWYANYRQPGYYSSSTTTAARQHAENLYYDVFDGKDINSSDIDEEDDDHQILYPNGR